MCNKCEPKTPATHKSSQPLTFALCHCVDVAFGSYVSMKTPQGEWVCIDTCIATEIGWLWHHGVETLNSCCGHQKIQSSVIVTADSYDLMDSLGYVYSYAPSKLREYHLTTGTQNDF